MELGLAVNFGHGKKGAADLLDLVLAEVLHYLRGDLFAETQQGQRSFFWI
jgi:hypothetical protein